MNFYKNTLKNAPSNATYISKTTQNEVISIIGDSIQRSIVNDCNEDGGWFSLSADEVQDTANNEQLAVTIRYVDKEKNIKENFLSFRDVSADTSGESLSKELLTFIDEAGLDRMKMHSQCNDGAGNMSMKVRGVGPRIQKQLPKALPFSCTAYQLNRCVVQACNIPFVRNMMCTADQVVKFFEYSPKKQTVHEKLIAETVNDETSRTKLKQLCRTRWVERHDAFSVFLDFFPAIVQTLEHFTKLPNTRTPGAADATSLLYSIYNFEFVVAIVIVQMCLAFMKSLSRSLQKRSLDVGRALENVSLVQSSLKDCRANVEQFNRKCYERSIKICEPLDIEIKKPRTCGRQTMRDNVQSEGPEDYFRKSIAIPFLDYTINEMKTRFTDLHARAALGLQLVPSVMTMLPKLEDFSFF